MIFIWFVNVFFVLQVKMTDLTKCIICGGDTLIPARVLEEQIRKLKGFLDNPDKPLKVVCFDCNTDPCDLPGCNCHLNKKRKSSAH